jgi:hypothetical protein
MNILYLVNSIEPKVRFLLLFRRIRLNFFSEAPLLGIFCIKVCEGALSKKSTSAAGSQRGREE